MLDETRSELQRVAAAEIKVELDEAFEPKVGTMVRVRLHMAYWHLLPEHFLELLKQLPDGSGPHAVHQAIEKRGATVWHGPSPKNSHDTSP